MTHDPKIYENHVATTNVMDRKSFMEHILGIIALSFYLMCLFQQH
jgi:hypothetical protein